MPDALHGFSAYIQGGGDKAQVRLGDVGHNTKTSFLHRYSIGLLSLHSPSATENRQIRDCFRQAVQERFGTVIADQVLTGFRVDHTPLSTHTIRDVIKVGNQAYVETPQTQAVIVEAMRSVQADSSISAHFGIYGLKLFQTLVEVAPAAITADPRLGCPLLASLAKQFAATFDRTAGLALFAYRGNPARMTALEHQAAVQTLIGQLQNPNLFPGLKESLQVDRRSFRTVAETLTRMTRERNHLSAVFGIAADVPLTDLRITDSDPHHGGKRVMILEFGDQKVVYKPRDCRIDAAVSGTPLDGDQATAAGYRSSVSSIVNSGLAAPPQIPTYKYLLAADPPPHTDHFGFVEYLSHGDDDILLEGLPEEQKTATRDRYYEDMGRYAGIAYLMGIADLHNGNVIVHGRRPYLTDLEFCFTAVTYNPIEQHQDSHRVNLSELKSLMGASGLSAALRSGVTAFDHRVIQDGNGDFRLTSPTQDHYPPTDNFLFDARSGRDRFLENPAAGSREIFPAQWELVKGGFRDVVNAIAGSGGVKTELWDLMNGMGGYNIRLHPIDTRVQLENLRTIHQTPGQTRQNTADSIPLTLPLVVDPIIDELDGILKPSITQDIFAEVGTALTNLATGIQLTPIALNDLAAEVAQHISTAVVGRIQPLLDDRISRQLATRIETLMTPLITNELHIETRPDGQNSLLNADETVSGQLEGILGRINFGAVNARAAAIQPRLTDLEGIYRGDWARGDVAYLTRQVGNGAQIFHHLADNITVTVPHPSPALVFGGRVQALARLQNLRIIEAGM
jgi:hypothetical protein